MFASTKVFNLDLSALKGFGGKVWRVHKCCSAGLVTHGCTVVHREAVSMACPAGRAPDSGIALKDTVITEKSEPLLN